MSADITCAEAQQNLGLYLYEELSFDEGERIESHLDKCGECRAALERERAAHAVFDSVAVEPAPSLLRECRQRLTERLALEPSAPRRAGWWSQVAAALTPAPARRHWFRFAEAAALVALGFVAARTAPMFGNVFGGGAFQAMSLAEPSAARVRDIAPASDGRVQLVLDETRQRTVSGRLDDKQILAWMLEAAKDSADPGLRAETVNILNTRAASAEVRDALVYALRHDQNSGVRLKAMEGLKPFVQDPQVRVALSQVLLSDSNPGLRTQAIDLLTKDFKDHPGVDVDRRIVSALQELFLRESNTYVRQRARSVLESVKASTETY